MICMTWEQNYLAHYGIKGQQWGVRRFQNEDGTLTEEGKSRYLDYLTSSERKEYSKFPDEAQKFLSEQLRRGKNWESAQKELKKNITRKGMLALGLSVGVIAYTSSSTVRRLVNSAGRALVSKIKNSNTVRRGSLYMQRQMRRNLAKKNGALVFKPNQYGIFTYK